MKKISLITTAFLIAAALTGCGSDALSSQAEPSRPAETTTATEPAAEETEPADTESTEPFEEISIEDDPAYWENMVSDIPETYAGDLEYNGLRIQTIGDACTAAPDGHAATSGSQFIYIIENDDMIMRFIGNMSLETTKAIYGLDLFADDYDRQRAELVRDVRIARADDLKQDIPAQETLDTMIGKTGKELIDGGYEKTGWSVIGDTGEFTFTKGDYEFIVVFEDQLSEDTDYDEEGALDAFTVRSIRYSGLSYHATQIE